MILVLRPVCFSVFVGLALALVGPVSAQGKDSAETDTYRFGGTFARIAAETPAVCAALCVEDNRCEAWSHSPALIGSSAQCELKRTQGRAENRPGFTSGIAGFHQVGALREEVGATVKVDRRNSTRTGLRARAQVFPENYRPVSEGLEVAGLLGAPNRATGTTLSPAPAVPVRQDVAPSNPYAPTRIHLASPITGKITGSGSATTSSPIYEDDFDYDESHGAGNQVILARDSSASRDSSFYEDD
ncbi:MAG: PAN domain-containing protein [Pseudomonadota bacterium]